MSPREPNERWNDGKCCICSELRPPGRPRYCSVECAAIGYKQRRELRPKNPHGHPAFCARCGKPKDRQGRGVKLCSECKEMQEQRVIERDRERHRRIRQARVEQELAAGGRVVFHHTEYRDGQRWCSRCQQYVDEDQFPKRAEGTKKRVRPYCRGCQRAYNQERRLRIEYGLTWDDFEMLLACQGGRCAICKGRPRKNMLSVDHDHKTGEIRGLLCSRCNHKLLGSANDDPQRLRDAADYLEEFAPREVFGVARFVPGSEDES